MPKIVNRHNAPYPFVHYASQSHYNMGDADYSVTTLIDSPQIASLQRKFPSEEEIDPFESKNLWSLVGTAIHHIMEQSPDVTSENGEPTAFIKEERVTTEYNGYRITGGIDLITTTESEGRINCVIGDYKFTTVYSAGSSETIEKYEAQLNLYRWILEREKDLVVTGLQVYAILRDWKPSMLKTFKDYPDAPGQTIEIPMWNNERLQDYVDQRLQAHLNARALVASDTEGGTMWEAAGGCSKKERWHKIPRYKIIKKGGSRAVAGGTNLFLRQATSKLESMNDNYTIKLMHPEVFKRCEGDYCGVSKHCAQYYFDPGDNEEDFKSG